MPGRDRLLIDQFHRHQPGYELNPEHGFFSIVVAEATTNLCTNPSFETNTTGWLTNGATAARTTAQQRRGAYGLQVTPAGNPSADGTYFPLTVAFSTVYTGSLDVLGQAGVQYYLAWQQQGAPSAVVGKTLFRATGRWQRVTCTAQTLGSGPTSYVLEIYTNQATTVPFYIDGVQIEQKDHDTTYCDGDLVGFVQNQQAYKWNGTPHGSTSARILETRSGGRVVSFDDYGLRVTGYDGDGLAPVVNIATPNGLTGGATFQRSVKQQRILAISGMFLSATWPETQRRHARLRNDLSADVVQPSQPLILKYQSYDCNDPMGEELELICAYAGGLEGIGGNVHTGKVIIQMETFQSLVWQVPGQVGATLGFTGSVPNANGILQRTPDGVWQALSTGLDLSFNKICWVVIQASDGSLYAGGKIITAGGVTCNGVARWNGTGWSALGTGLQIGAGLPTAYTLVQGPDGRIYVGGDFTTAGSVANTLNIAVWNPATSSWASLGTGGANGIVYALAFDGQGTLYAGGAFTTIGGVACNRVAKWNGSAWTPLGTGADATVRALLYDAGYSGSMWVGGDMATAGGLACGSIARWSIGSQTWNVLDNGGVNASVQALAAGTDGTIYLAGQFTAQFGGGGAAGLTYIGLITNNLVWPLGSGGINGLNGRVFALATAPNGDIWAVGNMSRAGTLTLAEGLAIWRGQAWQSSDVKLPGGGISSTTGLLIGLDGTVTVGFTADGTATAAVTSVNNAGSAAAWPRVTFTGPGRPVQLANYTTGQRIGFDLDLNAGETAVLDLTPGAISFVSSFQGNILGTILQGSQLATWRLQPGLNQVSAYFTDQGLFPTSGATSVVMTWRLAHEGVDAATYGVNL